VVKWHLVYCFECSCKWLALIRWIVKAVTEIIFGTMTHHISLIVDPTDCLSRPVYCFFRRGA
jgi:hypothetical protein